MYEDHVCTLYSWRLLYEHESPGLRRLSGGHLRLHCVSGCPEATSGFTASRERAPEVVKALGFRTVIAPIQGLGNTSHHRFNDHQARLILPRRPGGRVELVLSRIVRETIGATPLQPVYSTLLLVSLLQYETSCSRPKALKKS